MMKGNQVPPATLSCILRVSFPKGAAGNSCVYFKLGLDDLLFLSQTFFAFLSSSVSGLAVKPYALFQNGYDFIILLYSCKLALDAKFLPRNSFEF